MKEYKTSNKILCFDDILLVPSDNSSVESRYSVDLSMKLGNYSNQSAILELTLPIIASPMDTVCEWEMASAISNHGGLGIIHRFMSIDKRIEHLNKVNGLKGVAISLLESKDKSTIQRLLDTGVRVLCIDTANGHAKRALDAVKQLRDSISDEIHIMSGNVSTYSGYRDLLDAGADSIRVGIGGGSACTTRLVSGHGMPTLSSIMDCARGENSAIIADGGIRTTGDMVKAYAAGASAVMLGSLLSGYDESPGELIKNSPDSILKKEFRGMASKEAQENWLGGVSVSEGISTTVPYKGKVSDFLKSVKGGIGSGCSYSGSYKLSRLELNSQYVVVTHSSINESRPHATFLNK